MAEMEIEKTPTANTSVNKPESGTYGEKADVAALKASLPPMAPPGAQGVGQGPGPGALPTRGVPQKEGRPKNGPSMIPQGIMAGTQRPDVPISQPMAPGAQPMPPKQQAADQQRLAILDALTTHPEVSEETREWAQLVMESLIENRR
mgnify:CR=1 FL=1